MPNLVPQDMNEWMRREESRITELTRRASDLVPGGIEDGVDLEDFISSGRWRRFSSVGTTTALNYPLDGAAGTLEVYWNPADGQVQQIWYDREWGIWIRWRSSAGVWSAWQGGDTGWAAVSLAGGTSAVGGHAMQVRRLGQTVFLRGRMDRASSTGQQTWATAPSGFLPDRIVEIPHRAQADAASAPTRVFISTNGDIVTQGTPASNASVLINASWVAG